MWGIFSTLKAAGTYVDGAQQQQGRTQAQGVNGAENKGNQEEQDPLWLG